MKSSSLITSMSVIVSRSVTRCKRRLKTCSQKSFIRDVWFGRFFEQKYLKSARIVGDFLGKYHPHGDSSVYEAMVRLAPTMEFALSASRWSR
jgi:DNA gyrase/topoisomerase IV subunit A